MPAFAARGEGGEREQLILLQLQCEGAAAVEELKKEGLWSRPGALAHHICENSFLKISLKKGQIHFCQTFLSTSGGDTESLTSESFFNYLEDFIKFHTL